MSERKEDVPAPAEQTSPASEHNALSQGRRKFFERFGVGAAVAVATSLVLLTKAQAKTSGSKPC